ncbi:hypothetical protein [Paraburkholderia sp. DHOC27]|uniref:hypothetical protein n=1 Tax=Paraburkholderia sp. DHOC27 TaxID=2303330 RepID=UPI000E3BA454|nr:hypothetical protein [Paraburkholderia sp. DHOC27]RFU43848.1 hypothetical protein D0B32_31455 [Paraburkholderia sp. DHOC27]
MDSDSRESFFVRLIAPMLDQLQRIARSSLGEQSVDDLKSEAWVAAPVIRSQMDDAIAAQDERLQGAVLSKLRKTFGMVCQSEDAVRVATRSRAVRERWGVFAEQCRSEPDRAGAI